MKEYVHKESGRRYWLMHISHVIRSDGGADELLAALKNEDGMVGLYPYGEFRVAFEYVARLCEDGAGP